VEAPLPDTLSPVPDHAYFTVRFGLKLEPLAVAVTGSPAKTCIGCTAQVALETTAGAPPNMNTRPVWSLAP